MRNVTHIPLLLALLFLPGCAAVTAVSAVPGVLFEAVHSEFSSEEESFARNIEPTTAAVQKSLHAMNLDADVVEFRKNGYAIAFTNGKLKGDIRLEKMTPRLTTMRIKVRSRMREPSVERAIVASVRNNLAHTSGRDHFDLSDYRNLRAKPTIHTKKLGWYREDAKLPMHRKGKTDWLRMKLPSGKIAYLKSFDMNVASK